MYCSQYFLDPCSEGDVRLCGGRSPLEGRVEICFNKKWGRVCDDSWSTSDGNVVCRQLGFSPNGNIELYATGIAYIIVSFISLINAPSTTGAVVHLSATFGQGIGPVWLNDVHCSGTESRLENCFNNRVRHHFCFRFEESGVICQSKIQLKLLTDCPLFDK